MSDHRVFRSIHRTDRMIQAHIILIHLSIQPAKGDGLLSNPQLYWRFNIEKQTKKIAKNLLTD